MYQAAARSIQYAWGFIDRTYSIRLPYAGGYAEQPWDLMELIEQVRITLMSRSQ